MCGRVVAAILKKAWKNHLGEIVIPPAFRARYNISPTSELLTFRAGPGGVEANLMRWGLVPSWWKDATGLPSKTFNARAETVGEKPTFKVSFKRRRCIIPVNGFYEWLDTGPKTKKPFYIHPSDPDEDFAFAGLWDRWESPDGALESCTIITTEPNSLMAEIHTRMPVILHPKDFAEWLDPARQDIQQLQRLLVPSDPQSMDAYPVGPVRGEGPELIDKVV